MASRIIPKSAIEYQNDAYYALETIGVAIALFGGPETAGLLAIVGAIIVVIAEILKAAIQLENFINQFFTGLPNDVKTLQTADRLMHSQNGILRALGAEFMRIEDVENVPISDSAAGTQFYEPAINYAQMVLGIEQSTHMQNLLEDIILHGQYAGTFDKVYRPQQFGYPRTVTRQLYHQRYRNPNWPETLHRAIQHMTHQQSDATLIIPPPQGGGGGGGQQGNGGGGGGGQGGNGGGGGPGPQPGPCTDPCQLATIEQLANIANAIAGGQGAAAALANNIPALISALNNVSNPAIGNALAELVQCVCPNLDRVSAALEKQPDIWGPLDLDAAQVQSIADDLGFTAEETQLWSGIISLKMIGKLISKGVNGIWDVERRWLEFMWGTILGVDLSGAKSFQDVFIKLWTGAQPHVRPIIDRFWPELRGALESLSQLDFGTVEIMPREVLDITLRLLRSHGQITPDTSEDAAFRLYGFAFIVGQVVHFLTAIAGYVGYPMSSIWGHNAELVIDILSFDEIKEALHKSFFDAALGYNQRYHYLAEFRPIRPNIGGANELLARRKIDNAAWSKLIGYGGLAPEYEAPTAASAYRPVSARMFAAGFQNQDLPTDLVRAAIEDEGISPANVDLVLQIIENRSLASVRDSYLTEVMSAYADGVASIDEVHTALDDAKWGREASALALKRIEMMRRDRLVKKVVTNYQAAVYDGLVTPDQYAGFLGAAGAQQWFIDQETEFARTRAQLKGFVKELAAEAKAQTARERALTRAAVAQYESGTIDLAALTASLITIGLPADLAAATVTAAEAMRVGKAKYIYGLLLAPNDAATLQLDVKALIAQYSSALIDEQQLKTNLLGLKIPEAIAEDIVAAEAAKKQTAHPGTKRLPV